MTWMLFPYNNLTERAQKGAQYLCKVCPLTLTPSNNTINLVMLLFHQNAGQVYWIMSLNNQLYAVFDHQTQITNSGGCDFYF